jgi:hypothetical protein
MSQLCLSLSPSAACSLQAELRSLQHLTLDGAMVGLQWHAAAAADFIGCLTTLRSLEVRGRSPSREIWMLLREECYSPLQHLTQLKLPFWVETEALPAGKTGAPSSMLRLTHTRHTKHVTRHRESAVQGNSYTCYPTLVQHAIVCTCSTSITLTNHYCMPCIHLGMITASGRPVPLQPLQDIPTVKHPYCTCFSLALALLHLGCCS